MPERRHRSVQLPLLTFDTSIARLNLSSGSMLSARGRQIFSVFLISQQKSTEVESFSLLFRPVTSAKTKGSAVKNQSFFRNVREKVHEEPIENHAAL